MGEFECDVVQSSHKRLKKYLCQTVGKRRGDDLPLEWTELLCLTKAFGNRNELEQVVSLLLGPSFNGDVRHPNIESVFNLFFINISKLISYIGVSAKRNR